MYNRNNELVVYILINNRTACKNKINQSQTLYAVIHIVLSLLQTIRTLYGLLFLVSIPRSQYVILKCYTTGLSYIKLRNKVDNNLGCKFILFKI